MRKKEHSNYRHFGLIGKQISYSFSPQYFAKKFEKHDIDASYKLYNLNSIAEFPNLFMKKTFSGLNVTIPYKEDVMLFMDKISAEAKVIGAVNTIQFKGQQLIGHNTDYLGFSKSLTPLLNDQHTSALVLGTGGATKAILYALDQLEIAAKTVSRSSNKGDLTYMELTPEIISEHKLIINATPVGTHPNSEDMPPIPLEGISDQHLIYDLIYNPDKTKLLEQAEIRGAKIKNGLEMLEIQAEESWKIWNK